MSGLTTFWIRHDTGDTPVGRQLRVQQMSVLARRTPVIAIAVALNAILTAVAVSDGFPTGFPLVWCAIIVVAEIFELVRYFRRGQNGTPLKVSERGPRRIAIAATVQGLFWGTGCAIMFPFGDHFVMTHMFLGMVEAGMGGAGAMVLSTVPAAAIGYTAGCLLPFAIRMLAESDPVHFSIAVMTVLYTVTLLIAARSVYASFVESVRGRVANETLLNELSATRQDLLDAIASSSEGFALFDGKGALVIANDHFRSLLDLTGDRVRPGMTFSEILDAVRTGPDIEDWRADELSRHLAGAGQHVTRLPGGRWLGMTHRRAGKGGVVTTVIDLTTFKKTESELIRAKVTAETANRAKSEFIAMMSHEFRTPLNAILGFAEIFMGEMFGPHSDERYREYASDIHEGGRHLLEVINNILDLSKIEAGHFELDLEDCDLGDQASAAVRMLQHHADARDLNLTTDVAPDLPLVLADARIVRQMAVNLIGNAIKFTEPGGNVRVDLKADANGDVLMTVVDNGIGIAPGDMARILEPFGQADSRLSRQQDGTGLGLPLVRSFIELHGGTLTIESKPGEGTRATLRFPADRTTRTDDPQVVAVSD